MIATVIGRVSISPEEKESKKGTYYCKCGLAESDQNGKKDTVFYDIISYDERVGGAMLRMPKGKLVKIKGEFDCEARKNKTVKDVVDISRTIKVFDADHVQIYDNTEKEFVDAELYEA